MKKYLILIIITLLGNICLAQKRHTITATVIDSATHEPVELATVAVLRVSDSSLVSYTLTDKNGVFMLRNIREGEPVRLLISHTGYKSLHHSLGGFPKS